MMAERIDAFRADMFARYVQTGGENGEAFEPACTHESLYELTPVVEDVDHASYTAMCRTFGCHEFLSVVEYKSERPNEIRVLAGDERALAQKAWLARFSNEVD